MPLSRQTTNLSLSEKLEELVTCAVCHELLNNPKVFPCLHSYCYECIVKLSKRECGLKCPECCAPVEVRSFSEFDYGHCMVCFCQGRSVCGGGGGGEYSLNKPRQAVCCRRLAKLQLRRKPWQLVLAYYLHWTTTFKMSFSGTFRHNSH